MSQADPPPPKPPESELARGSVETRKRWLEFGSADETAITTDIDHLIHHRIDDLIASMYEHFLSFEETREFFPDDKTLERAQSAQKRYFERLTKGDYDDEYVADRLKVGATHYNIQLAPKWYIGAYNRVVSWILPSIIDQYSDDLPRTAANIKALLKIIFFDMELAIESYITAKEAALTKQRDAIRELETERRVTKSILESAPVGIVSIDEELNCLECNDEFIEIVGVKERGELIGLPLYEVAPGINFELFREVLTSKQPAKRNAESINLCNQLHQTETYWDWAAWPVKDDAGKVTGLVAMFANATDRVLLQQQREDFVATLTHDLKTPVSATNRAVRFMLDGDFGDVSPEQREVLETILQSNMALYSLVQTLLDVYRFDSGVKDLSMTKCNLSLTITRLITEIMPLAQDKKIELRAILPSATRDVFCDENEIRRVIQNLIDNSLRFTSPKGLITVCMKQDNGATEISVTDTGKGITPENMPKLFQRFWQAGSTGRYYASTGLGLYLCRRIVEAHNGTISCTSSLGEGSTFTFSIPDFNNTGTTKCS